MRFAFPPITPMVKRLVLINVAIYVLILLTFNTDLNRLIFRALRLSPAAWRDMFPLVPVWQVVTYGFLHSPDPMHVFFNMLGLYFFGSMVETAVGPRRFLVTYLGAILIGALVFLMVGMVSGSEHTVVGASGAVMCMIVAAACFQPNAMVILIIFPVPLKYLAGGLFALDTINGFMKLRGGGADGTSHLVHIVGAAYGFVLVKRGLIWKDPIGILQERRVVAMQTRRVDEDQRMDELLAKISRDGINSLSRGERDFLKRVSSRR